MSKNKWVLLGSIVLGTFLCAMVWYQFSISHSVREFHTLLADSKQEIFDLGKLQSADWDEAVVWGLDKNNCELGIDNLKVGSKECRTISNEREIYVLLLKNNQMIQQIPVNRRMIDLLKSDIPARIPKANAKFTFLTKGDFPTVSITQ